MQAFGFGIPDLFSSFEEEPVASGSIGQIHRAVLSDTGARLTGVDEGKALAIYISCDFVVRGLVFKCGPAACCPPACCLPAGNSKEHSRGLGIWVGPGRASGVYCLVAAPFNGLAPCRCERLWQVRSPPPPTPRQPAKPFTHTLDPPKCQKKPSSPSSPPRSRHAGGGQGARQRPQLLPPGVPPDLLPPGPLQARWWL